MTDEHRFDHLRCAGASFIRTPNLDRLAGRGVRFSNGFSNSPHCVPARIALATGVDPHRSGALDNTVVLRPDATTYYQRLRDAGYRVGCVGKLDLAKSHRYIGRRGDRPCAFQWGFTHPVEIEGKGLGIKTGAPLGPYGYWLAEQGLYDAYRAELLSRKQTPGAWLHTPSDLPAHSFLDSYQGRRAVEWLRDVPDDRPWHLFVSFSGPHCPHDPPREYFDRYENIPMPPILPQPDPMPPAARHGSPSPLHGDPVRTREMRRAYCAYIELIDEWIGRVLDVLDERHMTDSTYVLFTSDHGEMLGDLGLFGKAVPYEPSLRIPLIAAGPGLPAGQVCNALIELADLNPTICHLAGLPPQPGIDARSFRDCLSQPDHPHRLEIVASHRRWECIRSERYKLILNWNEESELYDLQTDPGEQQNRFVDADRQLISGLRDRLQARHHASPYGQSLARNDRQQR